MPGENILTIRGIIREFLFDSFLGPLGIFWQDILPDCSWKATDLSLWIVQHACTICFVAFLPLGHESCSAHEGLKRHQSCKTSRWRWSWKRQFKPRDTAVWLLDPAPLNFKHLQTAMCLLHSRIDWLWWSIMCSQEICLRSIGGFRKTSQPWILSSIEYWMISLSKLSVFVCFGSSLLHLALPRPFLDANGALSATVSASLSSGEVEPRKAGVCSIADVIWGFKQVFLNLKPTYLQVTRDVVLVMFFHQVQGEYQRLKLQCFVDYLYTLEGWVHA